VPLPEDAAVVVAVSCDVVVVVLAVLLVVVFAAVFVVGVSVVEPPATVTAVDVPAVDVPGAELELDDVPGALQLRRRLNFLVCGCLSTSGSIG